MIFPSASSFFAIIAIFTCARSTSATRTGPMASRSSFNMAPALSDMFAKIFSFMAVRSPFQRKATSSDVISLSSVCMPLSSTFSRSSNVNMSCLMRSARAGSASSILSSSSDFELPVHLVEDVRHKLHSADLLAFHPSERFQLLSQNGLYFFDDLLIDLFQVCHPHDDFTMDLFREIRHEVARFLDTQYGQHEGDGLRMFSTKHVCEDPGVRGPQEFTGHALPRLHVAEEQFGLFAAQALFDEHLELGLAADDVLFPSVDSS